MVLKVNVDLDGFMSQTSPNNIKRAQYAMVNQALSDMEQFVPKSQGHLRDSGHATADGDQITYTMPYAKLQFIGITNGHPITNYSTPGTGKRWDLKAKSMFMSSWIKAFTEGMK